MSARTYTVRPFSNSKQSKLDKSDLKDVFNVYLSPATLTLHSLQPGDVCRLSVPEKPPFQAIAWPAFEKIQDSIVQTSGTFQNLYSLKVGDRVSIAPKGGAAETARTIELSEYTDSLNSDQEKLDQSQWKYWEWYLEYPLSVAEVVVPGLVLEGIDLKGQTRSFRVETVNNAASTDDLYRFEKTTRVSLCTDSKSHITVTTQSLLITQDGIGGLSRQLDQLNERIEEYSTSVSEWTYPSYYDTCHGGILLHGPSGVGKSLILSKIANGGWASVHRINPNVLEKSSGKASQVVNMIFGEAYKYQPSVVILDDLEAYMGRPNRQDIEGGLNIVASLCDEMDGLYGSKTLIIAATTKLSDLDERLRRPGRFETEVEIPVPDARSRTEILKILSNSPSYSSNPDLDVLGEQTHGYVGADLSRLLRLAVRVARKRIRLSSTLSENGHATQTHLIPTLTDFLAARDFIRPTAMSQVFLETPKVRYSDIGGNKEVKRALYQTISWPLTRAAAMARHGITPQKALLLYGPPGCGKTLIAQAIATESHLNFLAVKGAELVSMYVGESERAIREVFHQARAAGPSILFFDEIDAIAKSRASVTSSNGLNVLTTLVNELDGIEALQGVFVLAATNCPEALDVALLRPGRFDKFLHVGLPDLEARTEILKLRLGKMCVDEDVDEDVDIEDLARSMDGYSGAEVVSVCQTAGHKALEEEEEAEGEIQVRVGRRHFEEAKSKVRRMITKEMEMGFAEFGRCWGS